MKGSALTRTHVSMLPNMRKESGDTSKQLHQQHQNRPVSPTQTLAKETKARLDRSSRGNALPASPKGDSPRNHRKLPPPPNPTKESQGHVEQSSWPGGVVVALVLPGGDVSKCLCRQCFHDKGRAS